MPPAASGSVPEGFQVTPIWNKNELTAAVAQPRAFLFLWVTWSIAARTSRAVVDQVVTTWQAEHPERSAPCFLADVSDQCGELWDALAEWLAAEGRPAGQLLYAGSGPLLWVRSGHVVLHALAPLQVGPAKLAAASRSAFTPDTGTGGAGV